MAHYDFSGWATRNDILCSDGRTIRRNAFIGNDGETVPLVWNHNHKEPSNILGHALLENRDEGVYCYGSFNNTAEGQRAKALVKHGDITKLSIFANGLRQTPDKYVTHGNIREVSLVLAGANIGAYIETLDIQHADDPDYDEEYDAVIFTGEKILAHAEKDEGEEDPKKKPDIKTLKVEETEVEIDKDDQKKESEETKESDSEESEEESEGEDTAEETEDEEKDKKIKHADESDKEDKKVANSEKTVQDVFDELTEEQKNVVYFMIGEALKSAGKGGDTEAKHSDDYNDDEEDELMHTNIFENSKKEEFLAHADAFFSEDSTKEIFKDAKRLGSLKEACLQHAAANNIVDEDGNPAIDWLFPDAKTLENVPEWINIKQDFVKEFMDRVHKSPFSRVKSIFADITETEARAKGYVKGNKKIDEVFKLLRRTTTPTTVYKKQTFDRDDVLDITDFDVIAWIKAEMRVKLDEELVRAFLVGDGRSDIAPDKIPEANIRPIWTDDDLFTIHQIITVGASATGDDIAKAVIRGAIKARKGYRGSGNPIFFTSEDVLSDMLLLTDTTGRDLYDTPEKLTTKLRVSKIVTSEIMENLTRTVTISGSEKTVTLYGLIVNPADYNIGTDKGGQVAMFDDFDLDYNQMKYLIETRCSGALVKPYSAIALEVLVNPT
jgi:HK97 family phage prohead protease